MTKSELKQLRDFIVRARLNTWATGKGKTRACLPGTEQHEYREGDLLYCDVFSGSNQFAGIEMVYDKGVPVWSMVYHGGMQPKYNEYAEQTFGYLKRILCTRAKRARLADLSLRSGEVASIHASRKDLHYTSETWGNFSNFGGWENIRLDQVSFVDEVYVLEFSGGLIDAKAG